MKSESRNPNPERSPNVHCSFHFLFERWTDGEPWELRASHWLNPHRFPVHGKNPKGVPALSPGLLARRATLGNHQINRATLKGLRPIAAPFMEGNHLTPRRNRAHTRRWIKPRTPVMPSISTKDHPLLGERAGVREDDPVTATKSESRNPKSEIRGPDSEIRISFGFQPSALGFPPIP